MIKVYQHGEGLVDHLVRLFSFYVHNKPDAAGVTLKLWVVKTLFGGGAAMFHLASLRTLSTLDQECNFVWINNQE
jgi:hypothetical protein